MLQVLLDPGLGPRRAAWVRALTGADELAAVAGPLALLDRLLVPADDGHVQPGQVADLAIGDRDRLAAAVYRANFGEGVEADTTCTGCGEAFSVAFSLAELLAGRAPQRPAGLTGPDSAGHYAQDGVVFHLPTSRDLQAVGELPEAERCAALLKRCVVAGEVEGRAADIEAALAALAPPLDVDLDARCPHCQAQPTCRFSITQYLMQALANERRFLIREVHRVALAYGWSYESILALPRRDRQEFVRLIVADISPGASRAWRAG